MVMVAMVSLVVMVAMMAMLTLVVMMSMMAMVTLMMVSMMTVVVAMLTVKTLWITTYSSNERWECSWYAYWYSSRCSAYKCWDSCLHSSY
ncbi:hypothetical protein LKL99_06655 [Bacillus cereus]|nr:hypothetical protein [Bacillus cereus]